MNDPELIANPEQFDPLRSYRLREAEELKGIEKASVGSANQMVTVSPSALTFGYGRHACPGRFFAANEIKMIIGRAILDYDFKNADGVTERYPNLCFTETVSFRPIIVVILFPPLVRRSFCQSTANHDLLPTL